MRLPGLGGDHPAVADSFTLVPGSAALGDFKTDMFVTGDAAVLDQAGGDQDLYAVADGPDPLPRLVEFADQAKEVFVMAEVLGRAAADEQNGVKIGGGGGGDGERRIAAVAGTFDISVPAGSKSCITRWRRRTKGAAMTAASPASWKRWSAYRVS